MSRGSGRDFTPIYWEIQSHPRFTRVWANPHTLGVWLQMLLTADAMWPMQAPMPPRTPSVRLLIEVGLVIELPGNRYSVRGLEAQRELRSSRARDAAAMRWQSSRNASASHAAMPRRGEERRGEDTRARARARAEVDNSDPDQQISSEIQEVFMGMQPRKPKPGEHLGQHPGCTVCEPMRAELRRHKGAARGDTSSHPSSEG